LASERLGVVWRVASLFAEAVRNARDRPHDSRRLKDLQCGRAMIERGKGSAERTRRFLFSMELEPFLLATG